MAPVPKVVIFSTTVETGGPFALFQLYDALQGVGVPVQMCLYDKAQFDLVGEVVEVSYPGFQPEGLSRLGIQPAVCRRFRKDDILILPEVQIPAAQFLRDLGCQREVIWWLSWDNAPLSVLNRIEIASCLQSCTHIFQSHYARQMAARHGLDGPIVGDYTDVPPRPGGAQPKTNDICVLARKAAGAKRQIEALSRHYSVVQIDNMTREEVAGVVGASKYFLDFGSHPGKDRLPREAIVLGCVPVVRRVGAATVFADVPLPAFLKPTDDLMVDPEQLLGLIRLLEGRREDILHSLAYYARWVRGEKARFHEEVEFFLGSCLQVQVDGTPQ